MKELKVKLTLIEETLGTASNNKNIHADYIASKAPDAVFYVIDNSVYLDLDKHEVTQ